LLTLVLGRAGTGKTDYIMSEIKRRMSLGESGMLLIVPEQYSHDAEKQLCAVCGDSLSLYAETLSFTRLCNNVLLETGGASTPLLDSSGQILALYRALESVAPRLKAFGIKRMRTELLKSLLEAVKEFKSYNITPKVLENAAKRTANPLADKLHDLALIYNAYDALLQAYGGDLSSRLTQLADKIGESSYGRSGHIYIDGFNDFTEQEINVIEELLIKKADITVCLTCDTNDLSEVFDIPHKTVEQLKRLAEEHNVKIKSKECKVNHTQSLDLLHLEKYLFDDSPLKYQAKSGSIAIYTAPSMYSECEYAAYEALKLVHRGYRWRDIGVMARNWEDYRTICENVFEKYDIPYFSSGKVDILSKPPVIIMDSVLEIVATGFEYKPIFKYIKSGLIDITAGQSAIIENYVLKWQIRGTTWGGQWTMSPGGYGKSEMDKENIKLLEEINALREMIIAPILKLRDKIKGESTVESKLEALYGFFIDIKLPDKLTKKAEEFRKRGEKRLADEYLQLWDIIVHAMDQMFTILGTDIISNAEFHKLFMLALSQNDIGVIPISLDRTALGGMAMSRRRDIKCLILIGATDENLPTLSKRGGALSDSERFTLSELGTTLPAGLEESLNREMNMIYSTLTLPSDRLFIIYSPENGQRPSFIIRRLQEMFAITEKTIDPFTYMSIAEKPYLELFSSPAYPTRQTQTLSGKAAKLLYGEELILSATSVDNYYSCPYRHFLCSGLSLKPRIKAEFDAATAGNFMHYVLERVFSDIKSGDGFKKITDEACNRLTEKHINEFTEKVLFCFEGKNERFKYLFERYCADVKFVVLDIINELRNSSFEPLDLELNLNKLINTQKGIIDRIDGYEFNDKIYLRIIDYKTRKTAYKLNMNEILHGRDLQMLIYLFALKKYGSKIYGKEIETAGVLYVPAREVIVSASRDASEEKINELKVSKMRRNGLILNNPAIIEAMENGKDKNYLPVKTKSDGEITGSSLINMNQFDLLANHVGKMIKNATTNIKNGKNECIPFYKSENENACMFCDYHTVCNFDEEIGDSRRFISNKKDDDVWKALEC